MNKHLTALTTSPSPAHEVHVVEICSQRRSISLEHTVFWEVYIATWTQDCRFKGNY